MLAGRDLYGSFNISKTALVVACGRLCVFVVIASRAGNVEGAVRVLLEKGRESVLVEYDDIDVPVSVSIAGLRLALERGLLDVYGNAYRVSIIRKKDRVVPLLEQIERRVDELIECGFSHSDILRDIRGLADRTLIGSAAVFWVDMLNVKMGISNAKE